jgi:formylglycine-generating enzyme required for sulfatase activity
MIARLLVLGLTVAIAGCTAKPDKPAEHAATSVAASAPRVNATPAPGTAPPGMIWVPGGTFCMGCENCGMPDALPMHLVEVDGFWMDRTPVTNADFERFVKATSYVTVAERPLDPKDFPGVPKDKLVPGSAIFVPTSTPVPLDNPLQWWRYTPGANWKHPAGPGSDLNGLADHPVVHVAFEDAVMYARWAGKRFPNEAEFEFAARGGLDRQKYPWGNEMNPGGKAAANTWQGRFPAKDQGDDGYLGTSPVTAFPPNGFNLYDMGGNVWQWCVDWYRPDAYAAAAPPDTVVRNPQGPSDSFDPQEPGAAKRVTRGGSYLCTDQYCARYLVGSRGKSELSSGASNLGFRLVQSVTR